MQWTESSKALTVYLPLHYFDGSKSYHAMIAKQAFSSIREKFNYTTASQKLAQANFQPRFCAQTRHFLRNSQANGELEAS